MQDRPTAALNQLRRAAFFSPHSNDVPPGVPGHSREKETDMDWDRIEGNWKQFTGKVKEQWGKLTDDEITQINGNREQLEGRIQERYGIAKDEARTKVDEWIGRM